MLEDDRDINPYLQQEVLSASPVRLRWMLINRAKELCEGVETLWRGGQISLGDQWSLRIREILGELLSGVIGGNPVSQNVADFYLFLLKLLSEAEMSRDMERLANLKDLLAYEAETWKIFLDKSSAQNEVISHSETVAPRRHLSATIHTGFDTEDFSSGSSFSLDV